jgi:mannose-1-phosphate guanylyltransferase
MKVDHVLILAAGKGTRMGEIGKELPKVLWPIFEKSLLELQVDYAKQLAPSAKIYINYFNYKIKFKEFIENQKESFKDITFIEEQETLDIGGAIHNLAKNVSYQGNLLILNSDQFVFIKQDEINQALLKLKELAVILFSYKVNSSDMYNALEIENSKLTGIIQNSDLARNEDVETYTGMSLVNLMNLKPQNGESKFFISVANFDSKTEIYCLDNFEYWDFGTTQRYYKSMFELFSQINRNSDFLSFLKECNAIDRGKVLDNGYDSDEGLNFSGINLSLGLNEIVLESSGNHKQSSEMKITWNSVEDIIS